MCLEKNNQKNKKNEELVPEKEVPLLPKEDETTTTSLINSDPLDGFEYQKAALAIMEMGFNDVERIKKLLVTKNGNVSEVLIELVQ